MSEYQQQQQNTQQAPQGSQQQGNQFPRKPGGGGGWPMFRQVLSDSKFRLSAEKDPTINYTNGIPSTLSPRMEETNPRFVIYPNIEGITDQIIVRMDPIIFEMFMDTIIEASLAEPGFRKQFITKNRNEENKMIYDEATTTIGRQRENGVVYIKVKSNTNEDIPELTFTFAARAFLTAIQGDGVKIPPGEFSCGYARSWANKIKRLITHVLTTLPKKKSNFQQGGQQAQGQQPTGGGGGYQQRQYQQNNSGGQQRQYQQNNQQRQYPQQQQPARQEQAPRPSYISQESSPADSFEDMPD